MTILKKTRQQVLKEKLESFQVELAITADPSRKFEMTQRILEIEEQITQHDAIQSDTQPVEGKLPLEPQ